jgi:polysaccharide deacetylase 2 family uncharacterized protein YibQ
MSMHGSPAGSPRGGGVLGSSLSVGNIATIAAVIVLLIVLLVSLFGDADDGEPKTVLKIEHGAQPSGSGAEGATAPVVSGMELLTAANGVVISDPTLMEKSAEGPLPAIAADGRKPMDVYARPFDRNDPRPRIAIIVGGLGLGEAVTTAAVDRLPPGVTLAFTPYGTSLQGLVSTARAKGHEVLLEIPLEPFDFPDNDPGPNTLLTGAQGGDNPLRLRILMSRVMGYAGFVNAQGAKFLTSAPDVKFVLGETTRRGLFLVDNGQTEQSIARETAAADGAPFARADVQIDSNPIREAIEKQFASLETLAKQRGAAIGIAAAYPVTIDRVSAWAASLEQRGIALAPVSALIDVRPLVAPAPAVTAPASPASELPSNPQPAFEAPAPAHQ